MTVLGGVVGGVLGFIVLVVVAEWLYVDWFAHHDILEGPLIAVLVGGGAFVGSRLVPRIGSRAGRAAHRSP